MATVFMTGVKHTRRCRKRRVPRAGWCRSAAVQREKLDAGEGKREAQGVVCHPVFPTTYHPQKPHAATPAMSSGGVHSSLDGPSVISGIVKFEFHNLAREGFGDEPREHGGEAADQSEDPEHDGNEQLVHQILRYLNRTKN